MPTIKPTIERDNELTADELWTVIREADHDRRVLYEHNGLTMSLGSWAKRLGLSKQTAQFRMKRWGTFEQGKDYRLVSGVKSSPVQKG